MLCNNANIDICLHSLAWFKWYGTFFSFFFCRSDLFIVSYILPLGVILTIYILGVIFTIYILRIDVNIILLGFSCLFKLLQIIRPPFLCQGTEDDVLLMTFWFAERGRRCCYGCCTLFSSPPPPSCCPSSSSPSPPPPPAKLQIKGQLKVILKALFSKSLDKGNHFGKFVKQFANLFLCTNENQYKP